MLCAGFAASLLLARYTSADTISASSSSFGSPSGGSGSSAGGFGSSGGFGSPGGGSSSSNGGITWSTFSPDGGISSFEGSGPEFLGWFGYTPWPLPENMEGAEVWTPSAADLKAAEEKWIGLIKTPDFEDHYPISGFDISQPYPGKPIQWNITVVARENIPAEGIPTIHGGDNVFPGAMVRFDPPPSMVNPKLTKANDTFQPDSSWNLCVWSFELTPSNRTALKNDDGTCRSLMSDDCIRRIQEANTNCDTGGTGPVIPRECAYYKMAGSHGWTGTYSRWQDVIGKDAKDVNWLKGAEALSVGVNATTLNNATAFTQVANATDMMLIMWGPNSKDSNAPEPANLAASLFCPRSRTKVPKKATDGGSNGKSNGSDKGGSSGTNNGNKTDNANGTGNANGEEKGKDSGANVMEGLSLSALLVLLSSMFVLI